MAVLAACLVFTLGLLAASPSAHEFFHKGAVDEDHECVITAFAVGEGLFVAPVIDLRRTSTRTETIQFAAPTFLRSQSGLRLPPACGPPAFSLV